MEFVCGTMNYVKPLQSENLREKSTKLGKLPVNTSLNVAFTKLNLQNKSDFPGTIEANPDKPYDVKTQEIFSIEEPTWVFNSGMTKAMFHDRQDLGFILKENTVLKARQVNTNFTKSIVLRILGNDSKNENHVDLNSDWVEIGANVPIVPFIETPYGKQGATIEYEIESSEAQKPLPIYSYGGSETDFFKIWDDNDAEYALIKDKDFQLLIPKEDKEKFRNFDNFSSIDELIIHFQRIFAVYNDLAGLDNSSDTDKLTQNRYFMKADASGSGSLYYSRTWTASTSTSVDAWLQVGKMEWGKLHEIGHGYTPGFNDVDMLVGEVFNNIFAVQYEYATYGDEADEIGSLFDHDKERVEKKLYDDLMNKNETYATIENREQLILLVLLKQKAGDQAFIHMYKDYRIRRNQPDFDPEADYNRIQDIFNYYYSEYVQLDFTPVIERWGISLKTDQPSVNRGKEYEAVACLAYVVPEDKLEEAHAIVDQGLLITSNFELVTNQEIAPLGLKGNLTIQLVIDDISLINDSTLRLSEGKKIYEQVPIVGKLVHFTDIPNGIYTVTLNTPLNNYTIDQHYAYVKDNENETIISVIPIWNDIRKSRT